MSDRLPPSVAASAAIETSMSSACQASEWSGTFQKNKPRPSLLTTILLPANANAVGWSSCGNRAVGSRRAHGRHELMRLLDALRPRRLEVIRRDAQPAAETQKSRLVEPALDLEDLVVVPREDEQAPRLAGAGDDRVAVERAGKRHAGQDV